MAQTKQVGEWTSPITSDLIVAHTKSLKAVHALDNGDLVWIEGRPAEKGRCVLVHRQASGCRRRALGMATRPREPAADRAALNRRAGLLAAAHTT